MVNTGKDKLHTDKSRIFIFSYAIASKMASEIKREGFTVAIVDEAHYLKSLKAKRTITLTPILQRCKRVILLSGTPAEARPMELFNLLSIIRPDVFTKFADFGKRYCDP